MRRICLLLTSILLIMTMLTACSKPIDRLSATELLDLGEKYLLEMNYEQAVVQFLKVIEIEPKNPRGYTGAAEAYVGLGQIDKAIEILEQGFKLTGDSSIQNMIKRLQIKPIAQEIEASVNVIKTELRSGNYPAAIAEVHSGTMLSFLRGQEDGSYFYKEEIWDESKNEMVALSIIQFIYSEADDGFPESVSFNFLDSENRGAEEDFFHYGGMVDSIIGMGGRTIVNYKLWAGDASFTYDLNEILGS